MMGRNWKMVAGAVLMGLATALGQIDVLPADVVTALLAFGASLVGVGAAHKAERAVRSLEGQAESSARLVAEAAARRADGQRAQVPNLLAAMAPLVGSLLRRPEPAPESPCAAAARRAAHGVTPEGAALGITPEMLRELSAELARAGGNEWAGRARWSGLDGPVSGAPGAPVGEAPVVDRVG